MLILALHQDSPRSAVVPHHIAHAGDGHPQQREDNQNRKKGERLYPRLSIHYSAVHVWVGVQRRYVLMGAPHLVRH